MNGFSRIVIRNKSAKIMAFFPVVSNSIFAFFVVLYLWFAHIPPDLHAFSGVFSIQKVGRNSYVSIEGGGQEKMRFTCSDMFGGASDCLPRRKVPELLGRDVTVYWYAQSYFPLVVENKLVVLEVGGQKVVTREISQARLERSKIIGAWLYGGGVFFSGCITFFFYKLACRQSRLG